MGPDFDWSLFLALAARHRVEGLVYDRLLVDLRSTDPDLGVPPDVRAALTRVWRAQSLDFLSQVSETLRLSRLLEAQGCPVIVLKGCGLARHLYAPYPEARHSIDIDLLVAPSSFADADGMLCREGYVRSVPETRLPVSAESMARYLINAYEYEHPDTGHKVELHHRLLADPYIFRVPFDDLLARSRIEEFGGARLRCLGPADLVVYLCCHAAGHAFFRLKWLADLARLFDREEYEVPAVVSHARAVECECPTLLALILLERLTGRNIGPVCEAQRHRFSRLAARAEAALRARAREGRQFQYADVVDDLRQMVYEMRLTTTWRARAFHLLRHASNHRDLSTLRLGVAWAPLYALFGRPLALMRRLSRKPQISSEA